MMSAGGWPLFTMDCSLWVAGARATTVPSAKVTLRMVKDGLEPLLIAEATTPPIRRNTASPRTTKAGPRTDIGS